MNADERKNLVLACGALAGDLVSIIRQNPYLKNKTQLQCLPAKLHNTPHLIASEVDSYLAKHSTFYNNIFVAYGDCGTAGALDKVLIKYGAERLEGAHCYEFFAGKALFDELIEEELGSFFVTDYLVKNFQRLVIKGLGLDKNPELFDLYFANYKKLVYLAQTDTKHLKQQAKMYAKQFGLIFDYRKVGTKALLPALSMPRAKSLHTISEIGYV